VEEWLLIRSSTQYFSQLVTLHRHWDHLTRAPSMMEPRRSTGVATTKLHILDRPLSRGKTEVRLSMRPSLCALGRARSGRTHLDISREQALTDLGMRR
jgi:hypothetical protein